MKIEKLKDIIKFNTWKDQIRFFGEVNTEISRIAREITSVK